MNNSLATSLKRIDLEFYKYADAMQFAGMTFGKDSKQYRHAALLNSLQASKAFISLDKLITRYGYPGKTLVGKEYAIAFSIISAASTEYKEKYYNLIIGAADKGELDWRDVAFFVDKVKVARKEKQVYCTQFKYDRNHNIIFYYPVEDKERLNERRQIVGLEKIDISTMNFVEE